MLRAVRFLPLLFWTAAAAAPPSADDLLAAAKKAAGGAAWDKLVYWHERGKVVAGGLPGTYETWAILPKLETVTTYAVGPATGGQGWDGKQSWTTDSSGEVRIETSATATAQSIQDAYRSTFAFLFKDRYPAQIELSGDRTADGKTYTAVKVTPKGAEPFEIWFDPASHLPDREIQLNGSQPHTFILSDWKSFGGIRAPTKTIDRVGGDPKYDTIVDIASVDLAQPIPESRFAPPAPPADDTIWPAGQTSVTVPFRLLNNHIYVDASINGQPPMPFVFDTGATDLLDGPHAAKLGVKVEGSLAGGGYGDAVTAFGLAKVESVSLGGLTLPNQTFGSETESAWIGVEGADSAGLLGYEFVKRAVLTIDYAGRKMTFTKPSAFKPPATVTAIPFKFDGHIPMVEGSIDGISGEFEIDTGSRGALAVMTPFAAANKLLDKYHASHEATVGYGVGGPARALLGRVGTFKIGPVSITSPVSEFSTDKGGAAASTNVAGNIGGDILKRFTLTLDYKQQLLWLEPNALAAEPEVFDRSGLWIVRSKDGMITAADIGADSPAAKAGIKVGDEIIAIDGQPAAKVEIYDLRETFKEAPGTKIALTVKGKDGERKVELTLADQV